MEENELIPFSLKIICTTIEIILVRSNQFNYFIFSLINTYSADISKNDIIVDVINGQCQK